MMKPFQIIWELIEFGIQAAFVYLLAIIIFVGFTVLVIMKHKEDEPVVVYKDRVVKQYIYPKETIEKAKECIRPAGCRVLDDGTVEY